MRIVKFSKKTPSLLIGLGLGLGATASYAEGDGVKISSEIRGGLLRIDAGDDAPDGSKPVVFAPERAKIIFRGMAKSNLDYRFAIDILKMGHTDPDGKKAKSPVDYFYMTWWLTKDIGVRFGQDKVAQGGWEKQKFSLKEMYKNSNYKPHLSSYKPMASVLYKFMGTMQFQIFNDDDSDNTWNSGTHPTFALQWKGKMMGGMLKPLLQMTSWDNNKSTSYAAGVGFKKDEIRASTGFVMDTQSIKGTDSDGKVEAQDSTQTAYHVEAAYNVSGFAPFFYFGGFSAADFGEESVKEASGSPYDTKGSSLAVGLRILKDKSVTPYVASVTNKTTLTVAGKAKDVEVSYLKVGLYAKF